MSKRSGVSSSLKGQTALVTGAAKRIGKKVSLSLAESGADLLLHYRSSLQEVKEVQQEAEGLGVSTWIIQSDFSDLQGAKELIGQALGISEGFDILINNASIFPKSTLESMDFDNLERNLKVNTWAPFVLSRLFARDADGQAIVNFLDTRIRGYTWSSVAYHLSKVLLAHLTKMTALAYAPEVRVNGVAPGLILPPEGEDSCYLEERTDRVPLRTSGDPSQVAEAVLFLLKNEFLTGQIIYVDGGRHLLQERGG